MDTITDVSVWLQLNRGVIMFESRALPEVGSRLMLVVRGSCGSNLMVIEWVTCYLLFMMQCQFKSSSSRLPNFL